VPRPVDYAKRDEIIRAATTVLVSKGVVETSLRALATELGTSARMLIHHFGTKERLIFAILTRQQRAAIPETAAVELPTSVAAHRDWCFEDWHECTRGERSDTLRIVEQVFGAACSREGPYQRYTWDTLTLLIRNSQARLEALGMPARMAESRSRIALAAFQGPSSSTSPQTIQPRSTRRSPVSSMSFCSHRFRLARSTLSHARVGSARTRGLVLSWA